jgi:putative acetyltransferase
MNRVTQAVRILPATREQLPLVRELFREYGAALGVDLSFQDFETEIGTLPGKYGPPDGCILLAWVGDELAGCIALRPLEPKVCEMKRLWVRSRFRGRALGEHLSRELIACAANMGYAAMRLDTLASMGAAQRLYRSLGFREIPAYYANPLPGTLYMERRLSEAGEA